LMCSRLATRARRIQARGVCAVDCSCTVVVGRAGPRSGSVLRA
jgi:hypothetical protein